MRFLADMGVSLRVIEWLRQQGHDAKHLREENLHKLPAGSHGTPFVPWVFDPERTRNVPTA